MKITKLRLVNFRSHADTTLELARVNILRGPNAAGKSSLAMALELLLTGRCQVTDQAGRGAEALIRTGCSELKISADVFHPEIGKPDGGRIARTRSTVNGSLVVQGPDFGFPDLTGKAAEAWIEQAFAPMPVLSAVLNAGRFLEMDAKAQRALLAGALASEPVQLDRDMLALMYEVHFDTSRDRVTSAAEVDAIYKRFYEARTQVNRELKALGELTAPTIPADMPTAAAVADKITFLVNERNSIVARRAQKLARYDSERAQSKLHAQRSELLSAQKAEHLKALIADAELDKVVKLAAKQNEAAKLDRDIETLQAGVNDLRWEIAQLQERPDTCPTCQRPMPSDAGLGAEIARLEKQLTGTASNLERQQTARRKLGDPTIAAERLAAHQSANAALVRIEGELKTLPTAAAVLTAPDTSTEDAELAALDDRLVHGRQVEQQVLSLTGQLKQYAQVKAKKDKLSAQSAALDQLCDYFGDKGPLKAALIGGRLPAFLQRINDVLARFGFVCCFELDPYRLLVGRDPQPGPENMLSLNQLSESEAYRFCIAFQISLAEATGVGFVVIDRADMLQPAARMELGEALLNSELDQAIVLLTSAEELPQAAQVPPGVAIFQLENDGATRITGTVYVGEEAAHAAV